MDTLIGMLTVLAVRCEEKGLDANSVLYSSTDASS